MLALAMVLVPSAAYAHQPRIVEGSGPVEVMNPEVSQAFYGRLNGSPAEFHISSDRDFRLYVGLLVPDVPGAIKAMSADVTRITSGGEQRIALLDGTTYTWTQFYEPFGQDNYFWGPEFSAPDSKKAVALKGRTEPAGAYTISVFNGKNQGAYVLVVGDEESFPLKEMIHAAIVIPRIKAEFFGYSPLQVLESPYGWGLVIGIFALAFVFGFIYRYLLRKFAGRTRYGRLKNIGTVDRRIRIGLAIILFVAAIAADWNPWLLFFSGFCVFEAIFSWCGFYAAIGRNTCPVA
jgi:hypothetical protein